MFTVELISYYNVKEIANEFSLDTCSGKCCFVEIEEIILATCTCNLHVGTGISPP